MTLLGPDNQPDSCATESEVPSGSILCSRSVIRRLRPTRWAIEAIRASSTCSGSRGRAP